MISRVGHSCLLALMLAPASALSADGTWIPLRPPTRRYDAAAVFDTASDRLVVFGGWLGAGTTDNALWSVPLGSPPSWDLLEGAGGSPPPRSGQTAILDPVRGRVIVFGGSYIDPDPEIGLVFLNDVWAASLSGPPGWTQLSPGGTLPAPRAYHVAVYDPVGDRMIAFGGTNASTPELGDTWQLTLSGTPQWANLNPASAQARKRASAIYDPAGPRVLLFGGSVGSTRYNDVRQLSLPLATQWLTLSTTGSPPSAREAHTAVYDPDLDRMIVFGGGQAYITNQNDVWSLSLTGMPQWSQLTPSGSPPPPRGLHAAAIDPSRNQMLVFGGYLGEFPYYARDVWALDLATPHWSELTFPSTPEDRRPAASFHDPIRERLVIFGGSGRNGNLNDLWAHPESESSDWLQVLPAGTPPPPRSGSTLVYDSGRDRAVLFGGGGTSNVWELSLSGGETWTELFPVGTPPSPRTQHAAIFDGPRDRMLVFGGFTSSLFFPQNEVWELVFTDPPAWNQITPSGSAPAARFGHSSVLDPVRDRMLVFGGGRGPDYNPTYYNDVWALSLSGSPAWTQLTPAGDLPTARVGHAAFYDGQRDRMVICNGGEAIGPFGGANQDIWALSLVGGGTWYELHPSGSPAPARVGAASGYSSSLDALLIFGGWGEAAGVGDDTWMVRWGATIGIPEATPTPKLLVNVSPNPFFSQTTFRFRLGRETLVELTIHDLQGREVAVLLGGRDLPAGNHEVAWDTASSLLGGGVYFYRLQAAGATASGRLVILH